MTDTLTPPPTSVDDRVGQRALTARLLSRPEIGSLVGALLIFLLFFASAEAFRNVTTAGNVLYQASIIGLMAVPVSLLMIGGEFDLSTGVAVTTSGLTAAMFSFQLSTNVWVGVLVALVASLAVGAFNGWLLIRTQLPSFLVTLGTFFILRGANLGVTKALTGNVATDSVSDMDGFSSAEAIFASEFSLGSVNIKITVIWWLFFTAVASWVLLRTRVGNWIFAVGGDAPSARAVGVPVNRTKIGLFMVVGFFAWFSGMHLLFEFDTVQSGEGVGKEFIFIIAAVVGGCLLTGGYGSVAGAAVGALIFGMTQLGVVYAGWSPDWFWTFLGAMLLLATIVNLVVKRRADLR
jgi:simple sugar transport system permease protein